MKRCGWTHGGSELDIAYHDTEWGVPVHDDHRWFEFLILAGDQCRVEAVVHFAIVFDGFDPALVARYGARKQAALLTDAGIVRNRLKVAAAVTNAKAFLAVQEEFGSFDDYVWDFIGGQPLQPRRRQMADIPARTTESDALSRDLKQRGFTFVGSTICYALMQAAGLVNDHETGCFRHSQVRGLR